MSKTEIFNYVQFNEDIATSGQPLPDEFTFIAESGYKAVVNIAMHDSDDAVASEGNIVTSLGMSYFHIPVPFDAPTLEHLRLFIKIMECLKSEKVWVHCAANYRVSAFMYQYQMQVYGASSDEAKSSIFDYWHPNQTWNNIMDLSADEIAL